MTKNEEWDEWCTKPKFSDAVSSRAQTVRHLFIPKMMGFCSKGYYYLKECAYCGKKEFRFKNERVQR